VEEAGIDAKDEMDAARRQGGFSLLKMKKVEIVNICSWSVTRDESNCIET